MISGGKVIYTSIKELLVVGFTGGDEDAAGEALFADIFGCLGDLGTDTSTETSTEG